jgi:hypothetical protein
MASSERTGQPATDGSTPRRAGDSAAGPGAISTLLDELARAPDRDVREVWEGRLRPGAVIGRFELLRELGRGGFGVVFEARDLELGRLVAFKALRPGPAARALAQDAELRREAEASAALSHPAICALYDAGHAEFGPYLILERLEGETLEERLLRGPLPEPQALSVATAVAGALAHAHAAGVVHRDLKPGNVFLTDRGDVKVLDLGLARFVGGRGGGASGSPPYMAPEQWRGEGEDPSTDVFALGVILFEMLAGARPFEVSHDRSTVLDPGPPPALPPGRASPALASLVARMLARDPAGRPHNGQVALEALREVRGAPSPGGEAARPPGPVAPPGRWRRFVDELNRRRVPAASTAYLAAAFLALIATELASWALDLPRWVLSAACVLAVAGIPLNAVAAWFLDVAPDREAAATPPGVPARARPRIHKPSATAVAVLVVLAAAAAAWRLWPRGESRLGERTLVVVADCVNRSGEPELDGLSGMLGSALEQSRRLSLLSRGRMLELLRQAGAG